MNKQLFIKQMEPTEERFEAPLFYEQPMKPRGGLWTSTFINEEMGSDWVYRSLQMGLHDEEASSWVLTPRENARIYTIDNYLDLEELVSEFGKPIIPELPISSIVNFDYEQMSKKYDGIHLTADGQGRTRHSYPYNLYGWDCECTLWLNWCFDKVENLGVLVYDLEQINKVQHEVSNWRSIGEILEQMMGGKLK